ncbi:MAG: TetR/AcrR family transcriptional regulator [Syntrophorhabdaceae bacterium]
MNRREASKKETRKLILGVTHKLCAKRSMKEWTLRDVAKAAGVSPASIVVHFKSKTALLEEVLTSDIRKALSGVMGSMPKTAPIADQLMHLAKGMLSFYDKNRYIYRALLEHTLFQPTAKTPNMSRQSEEYIELLRRLIEEQKTAGVIRASVDPTIAAASIFFLYLGALTMLFRMPEMPVQGAADILAAMTDQYLNGIRVHQPSSSGEL